MKFKILSITLLLLPGFFSSLAWSAPAEVPQTGQETCYDTSGDPYSGAIPCPGSHQDGEIQAGVLFPSPRFTDNGNGTVTDNMTELIWLKNANCFVGVIWADAVNAANTLQNGECNLSDGSVEGDWRLPNIRELLSLLDFAYRGPTISNSAGTGQWQEGDPFTGIILGSSYWYWTSTTSAADSETAWMITIDHGYDSTTNKDDIVYDAHHVWPVR